MASGAVKTWMDYHPGLTHEIASVAQGRSLRMRFDLVMSPPLSADEDKRLLHLLANQPEVSRAFALGSCSGDSVAPSAS